MTEPATLDPRQVGTIGRIHHGFLYQHVLASALVASHAVRSFYSRLIVERDEDIEVVCGGVRHYLQSKVEDNLVFSELYEEILRMHELRMQHVRGTREGECRLYLVSGGTLGPELRTERGSPALLTKVRELAQREKLDEEELVETWKAISFVVAGERLAELGDCPVKFGVLEQLDALVGLVSQIPRLANAPIVSAYALATSMHALAADALRGFSDRTVLGTDTLRLIEVVQRRVEALPDLPRFFVPLPLTLDACPIGQHTLLVGSSGCGKTSQLSYLVAEGSSRTSLYLRPTEMTPDELDKDLVLQLRAVLERLDIATPKDGSSTAQIPAFESLQHLVAAIPSQAIVIVDDAHLLPSTVAVRQLLRSSTRRQDISLILVSQPTSASGEAATTILQALAGGPLTMLDVPGWGLAETSLYLHLRNVPADPVLADSLRRTSFGSPIAAAALIDVCMAQFDGNLEEALAELSRSGMDPSVHGIIGLQFRSLPVAARRVAGAIAITSLATVTLGEVERLLARGEARAGFAYLREHRILLRTAAERFQLHELYRAVAKSLAGEVFTEGETKELHLNAVALLREMRSRGGSIALAIPMLLNQALAGQVSEVAAQLTQEGDLWSERLQRIGLGKAVADLIDQLLPLVDDEDRFWLLDALVFLNIADDLRRDEELLWQSYLDAYLSFEVPPKMIETSFQLKRMHRAAVSGDLGSAGAAWIAAQRLVDLGPLASIVTSQYANALFLGGELDDAWMFAQQALNISMMAVGIDRALLWSHDGEPDDSLAKANVEDVSRLADNIELMGFILERLGDNPIPMFMRSSYLFHFIGADKALRKNELKLLVNRARDPDERPGVRKQLELILEAFRKAHIAGGLIEITAALVSLAELEGDEGAAKTLRESIAIFDPEEVNEEIRSTSEVMNRPLVSDRVLEFIKQQRGR